MSAYRRYLEFAVVIVLIASLGLILLQALERARQEFEAAAVQSEVAALRVELLDRLAHREIVGGSLPVSRNPVDWAGRKPQGYAGEFRQPPAGEGLWYFDLERQQLVYRYRNGREVRYRLSLHEGGAAVPGKLAGVGLIQAESVK